MTSRPMRVFADGLRWLEIRRSATTGVEPLSTEDLVALAYAHGHRAGQQAITSLFVGCDNLDAVEIWGRFEEAYAWAGDPVDRPFAREPSAAHAGVRHHSRDQRQVSIANWAAAAFGQAEATSLPQRGLRLLEEAIEAFQACGGDEAMAHDLVAYVFGRPPGQIGQELGGVAVTTLALAAAAGLSADEEECREVHRVLSKPLGEFAARNARKNAAGFKIESAE